MDPLMAACGILSQPRSPYSDESVVSNQDPDETKLFRAATQALQSRKVEISPIKDSLYRTYRLRTAPGFFYVLRCDPPSSTRLLRREQGRVQSEVAALLGLHGHSDHIQVRLIKYVTSRIDLGMFYHVSGPFTGTPLAELEPLLDREKLAIADQSLGQYVHQLSTIVGPGFGPVARAHLVPQTWSRVFTSMVETLLRDGEDVLSSLPYTQIRDLLRVHRLTLDKITKPRLVILDVADDSNVVVDESTGQVTGLLEYATALWGDPFFSDCFYKPTEGFVRGFGRLPNASSEERCRQYLYVVYHALKTILQHAYRPATKQATTPAACCTTAEVEIEARRDLMTAMQHLEPS